MSFTLPSFRVGELLSYESLSVLPLFSDTSTDLVYRLASDGIADGSVVVEEVNESGSVPDLSVENKGDLRVLFLEGEELVGAKQNRVLNTSVLVAAGTKIKIPVSCVEQGRWRYRSRHFGHSGSHSSSKLRAIIKASVSKSARAKGGHRSDQRAVWRELECLQDAAFVSSPTSAMSDVYAAYAGRLSEIRSRFPYADGAKGMAIAIGKKIKTLDVFDETVTCAKVWDRLLSGILFDALAAEPTEDGVTQDSVEQLLISAAALAWEKIDPVGEGEEYRGEMENHQQASALVLAGTVVHGSIVAVN